MVIYYYFSSNRIFLNCKLPTIIKIVSMVKSFALLFHVKDV